MPKPGFPPPVGLPEHPRAVPQPVGPRVGPPEMLDDADPRERIKWYALIGALALLAVAGGAVVVNTDDQLADAPPVTAITVTTVLQASEPPVPTTMPTTVAATVPAVVPTTSPVTNAPVTAAPTTSPATAPATAPASTTVSTTPVDLAPGPRVEVTDRTGSFTVLLPTAFQTNVEPITIDGIDMRQVSGATDLERYLAGDFTVLGATALTAPATDVATPAELVALFDPGQGCTLTQIDHDVPTSQGDALVIGYDQCGGGDDALVLAAVRMPADSVAPARIAFVGLQAPGPSGGGARDLAIDILESLRQA